MNKKIVKGAHKQLWTGDVVVGHTDAYGWTIPALVVGTGNAPFVGATVDLFFENGELVRGWPSSELARIQFVAKAPKDDEI